MKLLIVGFSASAHTARWISQLKNQGWDIRVFPSSDSGATSHEFENVKIYHTFYAKKYNQNKKVKLAGIPVVGGPKVAFGLRILLEKIFPSYQKKYLSCIIRKFKPDIIHSMEFQHAGYLVEEVKSTWKGNFPKWVVTNWGSDIYFFGQFDVHKERIKKVLSHCDFYSCECHRDICLAEKFGMEPSKSLPVFPNSGGYNLKQLKKIRDQIKPSKRKAIILKGYQGWAGRAMIGLRALERCQDLIKGYELIIYSIQPDSGVDLAAELLARKHSMKLTIVPPRTPHEQILQLQSTARISIGLSISDAISTMVLEAMVMGSFPIQSNTSCADEWIENNKTGMIVPPEDPEIIEKAIRKALTDDTLVDTASKKNWETAKRRLDSKLIETKTLDFYKRVLNEK